MRGTLYGIGVGPGEPELMTVKALRCIGHCDVIILPASPKEECYAYKAAYEVYPEIEKKEIVCLPFPMVKAIDTLKTEHEKIYTTIAQFLDAGKNVAFLTIGDPSVYSTYSYIHKKELACKGKPIMVSGVPSFCAAAAALGISLGDNKEQIHIIPASYEIEATKELEGTRVYMKSGKKIKDLKEMLINQKTFRENDVYSISNCGLPTEKVVVGAENIEEESGYLTLVIVKEKN